MSVKVVGRDVEHDRDVGGECQRAFQLKAGSLNHRNLHSVQFVRHRGKRRAYVAHRVRRYAGAFEYVVYEEGRRGLAVRTRHRNLFRAAVGGGELELAYHGLALQLRVQDDGVCGGHAGAHDNHIAAVEDRSARCGMTLFGVVVVNDCPASVLTHQLRRRQSAHSRAVNDHGFSLKIHTALARIRVRAPAISVMTR